MCNNCNIGDYVFLKGMFRFEVDAIYYINWLTTYSIKHIDQTTMFVILFRIFEVVMWSLICGCTYLFLALPAVCLESGLVFFMMMRYLDYLFSKVELEFVAPIKLLV